MSTMFVFNPFTNNFDLVQDLSNLQASAGDLIESGFSVTNNQISPADVTGFAFANGVVRGFTAIATVYVNATAPLYEKFQLDAIQKGSDWFMSISSEGDNSNIVFSITNTGQIRYTSANYSGFVSGIIKFRATTTSV